MRMEIEVLINFYNMKKNLFFKFYIIAPGTKLLFVYLYLTRNNFLEVAYKISTTF